MSQKQADIPNLLKISLNSFSCNLRKNQIDMQPLINFLSIISAKLSEAQGLAAVLPDNARRLEPSISMNELTRVRYQGNILMMEDLLSIIQFCADQIFDLKTSLMSDRPSPSGSGQ